MYKCIVLFAVDIVSDGGKNIGAGQPTAIWKAQRRLVHEAMRLGLSTQIQVSDFTAITCIFVNGAHNVHVSCTKRKDVIVFAIVRLN